MPRPAYPPAPGDPPDAPFASRGDEPQKLSSGDYVVTPDGRVTKILYLTAYQPDLATGKSEPTQAIVLIPRQVSDDYPRMSKKNKRRRPRTTVHFDPVRYLISELTKATLAEQEQKRC